ncbi:helix-turn-helix domain-containing protein [Streptomyces sp. NPDC016675]|uniref:helix-turn-helix domain-containing protein n=1 Tax=Streptomyces sp. NPDC016675 TaxID=3364970 RepID=UPI003701ED72
MPQPLTPATRARIAELLAQGATNRAIVRALGVDKTTAARYRARLGVAPAKQPTPANRSTLTLAEKWGTHVRTIQGGHMEWTGRHRNDGGTMVFTHHGREYTARSVAFQVRTGRRPVGKVTAECDYPGCVAPQCVEDDPGRVRSRGRYAVLIGTATPLTECTNGHPTAAHRRFNRDGSPYCAACHADAATRRKTTA